MVLYMIPKTRFIRNVNCFRNLKKYTWTHQSCAQSHCLNGNGVRFSTSSGARTGNVTTKGMEKRWKWRSVLSVLDWWVLAAGGWVTWRGVLTRWTPLGLCLIVAMQLRYRSGKQKPEDRVNKIASDFEIQCYSSLPLRLFSRCFGWLADCRVPLPLRPLVYGFYTSAFGVNMSEAAVNDFKHYRSLAAFFSRALRPDARIVDPDSCLVAPCDGTVLHCGLADGAYVEQVKGVSYKLECFLGPHSWFGSESRNSEARRQSTDKFSTDPFHRAVLHSRVGTSLYQCVIYLAPGDYHRFHSPAVWNPVFRRHVPGELLSVNPKIASWVPGLFCLNERVHYVGSWKHGFFSFTAVGATNVGSVKVYMDDELTTNRWHGWRRALSNLKQAPRVEVPETSFCNECNIPADVRFGKGDLIGHFNMGSTIVLIFEAPENFKFSFKPGDTVRMGQRLGSLGQHIELVTKQDNNHKEEHCI